jgi:hypothetical protein
MDRTIVLKKGSRVLRPARGGARSMAPVVRGPFEVTLEPVGPTTEAGGVSLGAMSITKRFRGPLRATSRGQMLMANTPADGSAGYVAIERVAGTLGRRKGSFVLQHFGLMTRGAPELRIAVVPDSGTGQLKGLSGAMSIRIEGGKHSYRFEYALPRRQAGKG